MLLTRIDRLSQDSFADFGRSVIRVSVMMIGELEFKDTFVETVGKNNTVTKNPLNPFPEAAFSFGFVFLFLMCIVLMNLLVSDLMRSRMIYFKSL